MPLLNENELTALGIAIKDDPDTAGHVFWEHADNASESFYKRDDAIASASAHAMEIYGLHRCENCGKLHTEQTLVEAKHLDQRLDFPIGHPDCVEPSGECPDCGALCYPLETDPDWEDVMRFFGLDSSFQWRPAQIAEYTKLYVEAQAEAEKMPVVVLNVNGGVINMVNSNKAVRVIILDEDTEGGDEDRILEINGETVYLTDYTLDNATEPGFDGVCPACVAQVVMQVDAVGKGE